MIDLRLSRRMMMLKLFRVSHRMRLSISADVSTDDTTIETSAEMESLIRWETRNNFNINCMIDQYVILHQAATGCFFTF
jgi:hypothetical protein